MTMIRIIGLLLLLYCPCVSADDFGTKAGGDTIGMPKDRMSWLSVKSDPAGGHVFVDTSYVGITPIDSIPVQPGQHVLQCFQGDPTRWESSAVIETLQCPAGQVTERRLTFPRYLYVQTDPYGAVVQSGGKRIGATPLWIPLTDGQSTCTFVEEGFENLTAQIISDTLLHLQPSTAFSNSTPGTLAIKLPKNDIPIYLTAGAAVVFGTTSAYFKIKADHLNTDYSSTSDPSNLSRIHHYDTLAGISLLLCQINVIGLAYFFFSR